MGRCGGKDYSQSFLLHGVDKHRVMVAPNSVNSQTTPEDVKFLSTQDQVCTVAAAHLRSSSMGAPYPDCQQESSPSCL